MTETTAAKLARLEANQKHHAEQLARGASKMDRIESTVAAGFAALRDDMGEILARSRHRDSRMDKFETKLDRLTGSVEAMKPQVTFVAHARKGVNMAWRTGVFVAGGMSSLIVAYVFVYQNFGAFRAVLPF